jgi:hypothetical protein
VSKTAVFSENHASSAGSKSTAAVSSPPRRTRSRVTNGSLFIEGVDQRSTWVRRAKDVAALLVSDHGGAGMVSEAEKLIIRRAAVIEVELNRMEKRFAQAGEAPAADLDAYQRAAGNQRRLLESVGLKRVPRDVTPSLENFHANLAAERVARREAEDAETADGPADADERAGAPTTPQREAIEAGASMS